MASENLWRGCKTCGKQIAVRAKACPHCGYQHSRFRGLKWAAIGLVSFTVIAAFAAPKEQDGQAQQNGAQTKPVNASASKPATLPLPEKQAALIAALSEHETLFNSATNELQQSAIRDKRRVAILATLGQQLRIEGWSGTLMKLETNSEGKAIITVRIAPDVDLLTWNNSLSDSVHGTMIDKGTPLYGALMNMAVGDKIKVSGNFVSADADGIFENSMTIRGAMTAPEFLFRFDAISKQ